MDIGNLVALKDGPYGSDPIEFDGHFYKSTFVIDPRYPRMDLILCFEPDNVSTLSPSSTPSPSAAPLLKSSSPTSSPTVRYRSYPQPTPEPAAFCLVAVSNFFAYPFLFHYGSSPSNNDQYKPERCNCNDGSAHLRW